MIPGIPTRKEPFRGYFKLGIQPLMVIQAEIAKIFSKVNDSVLSAFGMKKFNDPIAQIDIFGFQGACFIITKPATIEQAECVNDTKDKFEQIMKNVQTMEEKCVILGQSTDEMKQNDKAVVDVITSLSSLSQENAACMQEAAASVTSQGEEIERVSTSSQDVANLAKNLKEEISRFQIDQQ